MTIKKAELHVHLEGAIFPPLALELAKRNKITLSSQLISQDGLSYTYTDFLDFLKVYDKVAAVIKTPRDYYDITLTYLKESAEGGCIYSELMYSPDHAEQSSGIPSSEHLQAIQAAIDEAEAKWGIIARIIMTAVRHFGEESAVRIAKQALKEKTPCVTGFGLGGDEANFPPRLFQKAYEIAAEGGLFCTVHAGEFAPAAYMIEAIDYLPIKRIGHGVNAIHCQETKLRLKDKNIPLEICPSSNLSLKLFKDLNEHPLPHFLREGIAITLSSDDPPFFRTTIADEYERVQSFFKYSDEQMLAFTKVAIEHAFVDEETKNRLRKLVNE